LPAWYNNFFGKNKETEKFIQTDADLQKTMKSTESGYIAKGLYGKAFNRDSLAVGLDINSNSADIALDNNRILRTKNLLYSYSKDIIVQSIIGTRTNQVRKFARPSRLSKDNIGYEIVPKNPRGKNGKPTVQQLNEAKKIEEFIQNTGSEYQSQRKDFPSFLSQLLYNHFVYDQINVERVFRHPNDNYMNHFIMVDARNVVFKNIPRSADMPRKFLQYPNRTNTALGAPIEFSEKELTFSTYNHDTDLQRHGYGESDVEKSFKHLKMHMDTEQFNARFFSQGGTTRGILVIGSKDSNMQQNAAALSALRRQWQSSFQGVNGAWKIPVISATDAQFVNMTQSSKDME